MGEQCNLTLLYSQYFSVLFTDPVYEEDQIFKAEVLPKAE